MALSLNDYKSALSALLPKGSPWSTALSRMFIKLLHGFAPELKRVDDSLEGIYTDAVPDTTTNMIEEWEALCGIESDSGLSIATRRSNVVAHLIATGGQSRAYFIALAAALGYTVTITEYDCPRCGDRCGDCVSTDREMKWMFTVNAAEIVLDNSALEELLTRLRPAHTKVFFEYTAYFFTTEDVLSQITTEDGNYIITEY